MGGEGQEAALSVKASQASELQKACVFCKASEGQERPFISLLKPGVKKLNVGEQLQQITDIIQVHLKRIALQQQKQKMEVD